MSRRSHKFVYNIAHVNVSLLFYFYRHKNKIIKSLNKKNCCLYYLFL